MNTITGLNIRLLLSVRILYEPNVDMNADVEQVRSYGFDLARLFECEFGYDVSQSNNEVDPSEKDLVVVLSLTREHQTFQSVYNLLKIFEGVSSEYGYILDYKFF